MTPIVLLGDISVVKNGKSNSQDSVTDGIYPFFDRSQIIKKSNQYLFDTAGTIIPGEGKEFIPRFFSGKFDLHQRAYVIQGDQTKVDDKYLYYAILAGKDYLSRTAVGSTVKSLRKPLIERMPIPLPVFNIQAKIADISGSIDDKIELNMKMNDTLEQMGQAIFRNYFITNPDVKKWESSTIGTFYEVILGGTPSREKQEYWENGTVGWINSGKVNEFRITEPTELITEIALSKSAAKLMPKGTTVLAITGATLGQVSRLEKEFAANQSVIGIVEKSHFTNEYAYYWINENISKIIGHQTGGAQQHINKSNVDNFELLTPPRAILDKFQEQIMPIMEAISINAFEIQTLTTLRDTLLPRFISGKIKI